MNVLYLHSHDTGRYIQPYGYPVPTPNLQRLADQGILFRRAFSAASTCSGSRAALITGEYPHRNGMMGLAHRGWTLNDYGHHLLHTLRPAGYHSELIGEQHVSADPDVIGYDEVHDITSNHVATVAPLAVERLRGGLPGAVLPVRRLLRDPPQVLRAEHDPRRAVLGAAGQPARHAGRAARRRGVQGQRAPPRPGRRQRARRARRERPRGAHAGHLHDRPRAAVPGRQGDACMTAGPACC